MSKELEAGIFLSIAALPGPAVVAYQIARWSKEGVWFSIPASYLLRAMNVSRPETSWIGVQKILDWLLNLPLSLWFCFFSLYFIAISYAMIVNGNKISRRQKGIE